jgi:hypothetical protein
MDPFHTQLASRPPDVRIACLMGSRTAELVQGLAGTAVCFCIGPSSAFCDRTRKYNAGDFMHGSRDMVNERCSSGDHVGSCRWV